MRILLSENDVLKVSVGDEVEIEVDAYLGRKFKGTVSQIANSASNIASTSSASLNTDKVTNFVVKISVDEKSYADIATGNTKYPLRPGMSASVDIFTDEAKDIVSVPIQSVTIREKESAKDKKKKEKIEGQEDSESSAEVEFDEVVFLIDADTAKMVKVEIGIQDDEFIMIKSGIKLGDKVITGPYTEVSKNLKSGDKVRIKEDKDDKKEEK